MPPLITKADRPAFVKGDLWEFHKQGYWVVVTTNIGWKKDHSNVMGAGVAKQAAYRFPDLPEWYGDLCVKYKDGIGICLYNEGKLIMLPTKPLNRAAPHLSWQGNSSLPLIESGLQELVAVVETEKLRRVALSYPGCGNGGLDVKVVKPLLTKYLNSRFTVVERAD